MCKHFSRRPLCKGCLLVGLLEEKTPVLDSSNEITDVDVAKVVFVPGPLFFKVIDLEFDVFGDPFGLDWGKVGADDGPVGMGISKVDRPHA